MSNESVLGYFYIACFFYKTAIIREIDNAKT